MTETSASTHRTATLLTFGISLSALAISFYLSEVLHHVPSPLLWYQRMALVPLIIVSGVGLVRASHKGKYYSVPVALVGIVLSLYHYIVQQTSLFGVDPECLPGENCYIYFQWFGFVTLPLLFAVIFIIILLLAVVGYKIVSRERR